MPKKKVHIGRELEKAIRDSGRPILSVAKLMDIDRNTLYSVFERENPDLKYVAAVGKILQKDFSVLVPDLPQYLEQRGESIVIEDPAAGYQSQSLSKCIREKQQLQEKYIKQLEITNTMLRGVIIDIYQSLNLKPGRGLNLEELRG
jgi:hypothetical protein